MNRRKIEEYAKSRGVALAAPQAAPPVSVPSSGFMAKLMPNGAQIMADLKAQLPPELYQEALDYLKRGGGYVIDLETMIAVGSPPVGQWERGYVETRGGLAIMRVRPKQP